MQSKMTPGTWTYGLCDNGNTTHLPLYYQRVYIPSNDAVFVTGTNAEANAKAIAAVPELINAIKHVKADIENVDTSNRTILERATLFILNAALRKAGIE